MKLDFNQNWRFCKENETKKSVNLPHDAMLEETRDTECLNGKNTGFFPGGRYCYEKTFEINESELGMYVALEFEGVYRHARILLNQEEVTFHAYGYTGFTVDISDKVQTGKNVITIWVDNRLEPNSRWYSGSGIYRPVWMIKKPKEHIEGLKITTVSIAPPVIEVTAKNSTEARVEIYDRDTLIKSGTLGQIELTGAKLWDAEHPNLYTCVVKTETDEERCEFGIRKITWSAKEGLRINGQETLLRGGCIHHDNGILGACAFAASEERKVRILKECGYNAIRSSHNPCSEALLKACDRLGMYVMDEAFDGWYTPKTHHDYARDFEQNYQADITAMVERDYSHPSVIMYSIGNEVTETASQKGISLTERMVQIIHDLDSTRPATCGINATLNLLSAGGRGIYQDSGEYIPEPTQPAGKKKQEKKSGSALFNFLMQKMNTITSRMSASKGATRAIEEAAEKLDILGLNYGERRYEKDVRDYRERMIVGSETLISDLCYNWERVKKYPAIIGDFCWTAWDYLGETGLGDWSYPTEKGIPLTAGCGAIDLIGIPGAQNAYQKVVWGLQSKPYIGVCPVDHAKETPFCGRWRFTNAIDNWNWQGLEGEKAVIEVFADASYVTLFLNGKKIATRKIKDYRATFRTKYQPGTLEAVAYEADGTEISRNRLVSGKQPARLKVTADKESLKADGQDISFLTVELTDENGAVYPVKELQIRVEVGGAGTLQGFGSAATKTDESFLDNTHTTCQGRALAAIRAGCEPGEIFVTVSAEGFETQNIYIEVM